MCVRVAIVIIITYLKYVCVFFVVNAYRAYSNEYTICIPYVEVKLNSR